MIILKSYFRAPSLLSILPWKQEFTRIFENRGLVEKSPRRIHKDF